MISHHFGGAIVIIYMDLKSVAMIKASLLLLARHAWQNPETPDSPVLLALKLCGLYIVKITPFSLLFDLRHKRTKKLSHLIPCDYRYPTLKFCITQLHAVDAEKYDWYIY